MIYAVTDGTGVILRTGSAPDDATVALQAGSGETALIIGGGDGGFVDDTNVMVVDGAFAAKGGYDGPLPVADQLTLPE